VRAAAELVTVIGGVIGVLTLLYRLLRPRLDAWAGVERRRKPSEHLRRVRELEEENREIDEIRRRIESDSR
jgi:hypothetical protein